MLEKHGDIWKQEAELLCITTNGTIKANGAAVMGRGVAKQARNRIPDIDKALGRELIKGNHVYWLCRWRYVDIVSFPVKNEWWMDANLDLIRQSTIDLVNLVDEEEYKTIIMPRPGCGNGQLSWDEVKPVLDEYLDDRFTIIEYYERKK